MINFSKYRNVRNGTRGYFERITYYEKIEDCSIWNRNKLVWSEEKKCYHFKKKIIGVMMNGNFIVDIVQPIQYSSIINNLFTKIFQPLPYK